MWRPFFWSSPSFENKTGSSVRENFFLLFTEFREHNQPVSLQTPFSPKNVAGFAKKSVLATLLVGMTHMNLSK